MFEDARKTGGHEKDFVVQDLAELVAEAIELKSINLKDVAAACRPDRLGSGQSDCRCRGLAARHRACCALGCLACCSRRCDYGAAAATAPLSQWWRG